MYLMGSFWAESAAGNAINHAQRPKRRKHELETLRMWFVVESVCLYRLRREEVNETRYLFRAAPRKAKPALFTRDAPASSMQKIHMPLRAAHAFKTCPALFARDGAP